MGTGGPGRLSTAGPGQAAGSTHRPARDRLPGAQPAVGTLGAASEPAAPAAALLLAHFLAAATSCIAAAARAGAEGG